MNQVLLYSFSNRMMWSLILVKLCQCLDKVDSHSFLKCCLYANDAQEGCIINLNTIELSHHIRKVALYCTIDNGLMSCENFNDDKVRY